MCLVVQEAEAEEWILLRIALMISYEIDKPGDSHRHETSAPHKDVRIRLNLSSTRVQSTRFRNHGGSVQHLGMRGDDPLYVKLLSHCWGWFFVLRRVGNIFYLGNLTFEYTSCAV